MKGRNLSIESLRGLAIVLMVAGHVIGDDATRGMTVADGSAWRTAYLLLEDVRMPLFAALSGFVYGYRPVTDRDRYGLMLTGKVQRLLVPLVTVGSLFLLVQALTPGTHEPITIDQYWRLFVFGAGQFWFLQALFLIFLVVGALDVTGVLARRGAFAAILTAAIALAVLVQVPDQIDVFSVAGAILLLPFFLLGYGMNRHVASVRAPVAVALAAVFAVLYTLRVLDIARILDYSGLAERTDRVLVGVLAVALLIAIRDHIRWPALAWLGQFAFVVYLFHVFGAAGARIALSRLGVDQDWVVFLVCMVVALGLPILFEVTLGRIAWISWAFIGQKPWKPRSSRPPLASASTVEHPLQPVVPPTDAVAPSNPALP